MKQITRDEIGIMVGIILFAVAVALGFAGKNPRLIGTLLLIVGMSSVIFSKQVVRVINRDYHTSYTSRFPLLWGIGVIIFGLASILGLP